MITTRPTTQDAEQTLCRIQSDLRTVQEQLHQLHATAPLEGPIAGQLRAARRHWFEVEYQASGALMLSRQTLAMLNIHTSTSREEVSACTAQSSEPYVSSSA